MAGSAVGAELGFNLASVVPHRRLGAPPGVGWDDGSSGPTPGEDFWTNSESGGGDGGGALPFSAAFITVSAADADGMFAPR